MGAFKNLMFINFFNVWSPDTPLKLGKQNAAAPLLPLAAKTSQKTALAMETIFHLSLRREFNALFNTTEGTFVRFTTRTVKATFFRAPGASLLRYAPASFSAVAKCTRLSAYNMWLLRQ